MSLLLFPPGLRAQGILGYVVLETGGGTPLVSTQQMVSLSGLSAPMLSFDFGFRTDEVPTPILIPDSFTVTLQDASSTTAVLVTAGANGTQWAPATPGAIPLSGADIHHQAITPPSLQPILGMGVAYEVQMPIPTQFTGSTLTVYFDLFDNGNGIASAGWYHNLQVVSVPEPETAWMAGAGLLVWMVIRRKRIR